MHPLRTPPIRFPAPGRPPANRRPVPALRLVGERAEAGPTGELARDGKLARLEAALFLAEEPLVARRLAAVAGLADAAEARRLVARLRDLYDRDGTAFQVTDVAGGYQLLTRPEFFPWLARLGRPAAEPKLTPAVMETLAVVAYKQPVTRADVEAVRGVKCDEPLRQLMERDLVRIAGRHDSLGRPLLYGTTRRFLMTFGLNALKDLPAG